MRHFNRFYTRQIGLLEEGLLNSPFSLTQVRTLYELAQCEQTTAVELSNALGLDAGYLSRILASFEKAGLVEKKQSPKTPAIPCCVSRKKVTRRSNPSTPAPTSKSGKCSANCNRQSKAA